MDIDTWILHHFMCHKVFSFFQSFPPSYKNVKTILSLQAVQKQVACWIWLNSQAVVYWPLVYTLLVQTAGPFLCHFTERQPGSGPHPDLYSLCEEGNITSALRGQTPAIVGRCWCLVSCWGSLQAVGAPWGLSSHSLGESLIYTQN